MSLDYDTIVPIDEIEVKVLRGKKLEVTFIQKHKQMFKQVMKNIDFRSGDTLHLELTCFFSEERALEMMEDSIENKVCCCHHRHCNC